MDLQLFTTILTIASAVGAGSSIFLYNRSRSLITLLKDENAALVGSNTRLEKELEVEQTKRKATETERDIWRDNVTQAPSIELLATKTAQQHGEVLNGLGEVVTVIADLTKEMRKERESK
jgi:CRISPR/Cas system-associated endonuclease Cas3-HD